MPHGVTRIGQGLERLFGAHRALEMDEQEVRLARGGRNAVIAERRDRLLASRRFQRWAAAFPLTRPIARRRARALFDLCAGFVYSQVLFACVRLKLFDALAAGPLAVAGTAGPALAGILLTPVIGLQYYDLTLLVISAYAAAMLGRLKSLPLTFAGAMGLGLMQSYAVGYLPSGGDLAGLRAVVPTLFLFAVIVLMPQAQLRVGQVKGIVSAPLPSLQRMAGSGAALIVVVAVLSLVLGQSSLLLAGTAATYAMVMLSLVLLTGYGGQVSLCQLTFVVLGAYAMGTFGGGGGFPGGGSFNRAANSASAQSVTASTCMP